MSKYNNLKKQILNDKNYSLNIDNDGIINVNIKNNEQIISPYCENNNLLINSDFAEFLNNSVKDIPLSQNLTLQISSNNGNIYTINTAVKNYYYKEFADTEYLLKINLKFSILTFIIGLFALALSLTQLIIGHPLWAGTIDIFAWVFIWEAIDLFFFRRHQLKHQQYRNINFINATIILKN